MKKAKKKLIVLLGLIVVLSACGREKDTGNGDAELPRGPQITEVVITGANFYDYFDFREYPSFATDEDGTITACNLSYGFSLQDGYVAANDPEHPDSLVVSFRAEGVSRYGEYDVDFRTLRYTGETVSEEREIVEERLPFWAQGGRTVSYPYGTLSSSYIIRFENFTVTGVSGSIWLLTG